MQINISIITLFFGQIRLLIAEDSHVITFSLLKQQQNFKISAARFGDGGALRFCIFTMLRENILK